MHKVCISVLVCLAWAPAAAGEVLGRLFEEEQVYDAGSFGGEVWYGAESGAYRVIHNKRSQVLHGPAFLIVSSGDEIWIASGTGLYRIDKEGQASSLSNYVLLPGSRRLHPRINDIESVGKTSWVATGDALFEMSRENRTFHSTPILNTNVLSLAWVEDRLWVGTANNILIYQADGSGTFRAIFEKEEADVRIKEITPTSDGVWVTTTTLFGQAFRCYRFERDGSRLGPYLSEALAITSVVEGENGTFFGSINGLSRLIDGGGIQVVYETENDPVNVVALLNETLWMGTSSRIYAGDAKLNRFDPVPAAAYFANKLSISGFFEAGGRTWAWGGTGLYRFENDAKVELKTSMMPFGPLWLSIGKSLRLREIGYVDAEGRDPFEGAVTEQFDVFAASSAAGIDDAILNEEFSRPSSFAFSIPGGFSDVYLAVRDSVGNIHREDFKRSLDLQPWLLSIPALSIGVVFLWLVAIFSIVSAPRFPPGMALVDSKFFRTRASFGSIPMLLLVNSIRRYLLKRYRRNLIATASSCSAALGSRQIVSADVDTALLFEKLLESPKIVVVGPAPERLRYFQALARGLDAGLDSQAVGLRSSAGLGNFKKAWEAWQLAFDHRRLRRAIPLYLKLDTYLCKKHEDPGEEDLREGAFGELANFGEIYAPDLGQYFLDRGGFLFFMDRFGKLEPEGRRAFWQFINRYERENLIIVGCGQMSDELEGFGFPIYLEALSELPVEGCLDLEPEG